MHVKDGVRGGGEAGRPEDFAFEPALEHDWDFCVCGFRLTMTKSMYFCTHATPLSVRAAGVRKVVKSRHRLVRSAVRVCRNAESQRIA